MNRRTICLNVSLDLNFSNLPRIRKLYRQRPIQSLIQLDDSSLCSEELDSFLYEDYSDCNEFEKERPSRWKKIYLFIDTASFPDLDFKASHLSPQDLINRIQSAKNCFLDSGFQDDEIKLSTHSESLLEYSP